MYFRQGEGRIQVKLFHYIRERELGLEQHFPAPSPCGNAHACIHDVSGSDISSNGHLKDTATYASPSKTSRILITKRIFYVSIY